LLESGAHGIEAVREAGGTTLPPASGVDVAFVDKATFALDCESSGDVGSAILLEDHWQKNAPAKLFGHQRATRNDYDFR
jgi:hypothetical protein